MDRQAIIADLMQALHCVDDAGRHIGKMRSALRQGRDIPRADRSHAAEKLNRATEFVRRSYTEGW